MFTTKTNCWRKICRWHTGR